MNSQESSAVPDTSYQLTLDQQLLDARLKSLEGDYPAKVHAAAASWAGGIRSILGLTTTMGLIAAPFASEVFSDRSRRVVGLLLVSVFIAAAVGLYLTMSAAYGLAPLAERPSTLTALEKAILEQADADRRKLRIGIFLALTAVSLLACAVAVAWLL